MSNQDRKPSEEELRAAYEAEIKKLRVEHVLLDHVATVANLGMRRTGLAPGTENERDAGQVRLAIESIRALLPLVEQSAPQQVGAIREAVSQLQLAFVRIGGQAASPGAGEAAAGQQRATQGGPERPADQQREQGPQPPKPGEPGPAQRSGRLWVPGQ